MNASLSITRTPVQQCRFCRCTPEEPCKLPHGDECMFLDAKGTRCNAPECVLAFEAERDGEWLRESRRLKVLRDVRECSKQSRKSRNGRRRAA